MDLASGQFFPENEGKVIVEAEKAWSDKLSAKLKQQTEKLDTTKPLPGEALERFAAYRRELMIKVVNEKPRSLALNLASGVPFGATAKGDTLPAGARIASQTIPDVRVTGAARPAQAWFESVPSRRLSYEQFRRGLEQVDEARKQKGLLKNIGATGTWRESDFREPLLSAYRPLIERFNGLLQETQMTPEKFRLALKDLRREMLKADPERKQSLYDSQDTFDELKKWLDSIFGNGAEAFDLRVKQDPVRAAVDAFVDFYYVHSFNDSNHRLASFVMNYVLIKTGQPPFILDASNVDAYLGIVRTFYTKRASEEIRREFAELVRNSITQPTAGARMGLFDAFRAKPVVITVDDVQKGIALETKKSYEISGDIPHVFDFGVAREIGYFRDRQGRMILRRFVLDATQTRLERQDKVLEPGRTFTIGTDPSCDIVFASTAPGIAPWHLELKAGPTSIRLTKPADLANGSKCQVKLAKPDPITARLTDYFIADDPSFLTWRKEEKPFQRGWKAHVSGNAETACEIMDLVLPVLHDRGIGHKVVASAALLKGFMDTRPDGSVNPQAGKFITIYARGESRENQKEFADLLRQINRILVQAGYRNGQIQGRPAGPKVRGEISYPECELESGMVSYRYTTNGSILRHPRESRIYLKDSELRQVLEPNPFGLPDLLTGQTKGYMTLAPGSNFYIDFARSDGMHLSIEGHRFSFKAGEQALSFQRPGGSARAVPTGEAKGYAIPDEDFKMNVSYDTGRTVTVENRSARPITVNLITGARVAQAAPQPAAVLIPAKSVAAVAAKDLDSVRQRLAQAPQTRILVGVAGASADQVKSWNRTVKTGQVLFFGLARNATLPDSKAQRRAWIDELRALPTAASASAISIIDGIADEATVAQALSEGLDQIRYVKMLPVLKSLSLEELQEALEGISLEAWAKVDLDVLLKGDLELVVRAGASPGTGVMVNTDKLLRQPRGVIIEESTLSQPGMVERFQALAAKAPLQMAVIGSSASIEKLVAGRLKAKAYSDRQWAVLDLVRAGIEADNISIEFALAGVSDQAKVKTLYESLQKQGLGGMPKLVLVSQEGRLRRQVLLFAGFFAGEHVGVGLEPAWMDSLSKALGISIRLITPLDLNQAMRSILAAVRSTTTAA
ncbi:MAG: hypothetical protein WCG06_01510 [Candidatus Omnitrophota bacterium]